MAILSAVCIYCVRVSRGKGDGTGKLYWASFVEWPELAGISGRGRAVTLTCRAPCWVTRLRPV